MPLAQLAKAGRQKFGAETIRRADAHRAGGFELGVSDRLCRGGRELVHLLGHDQQPLTCLGEGGAAGAPVEQLGTERCFERGDAAAERRIIDLQALRRGRHAARARDGEKRADEIPVELVGHQDCFR